GRLAPEADRLVAADHVDVDVDQAGEQGPSLEVDLVVGADRAAVRLDLDDPRALDLDGCVVVVAPVARDQVRAGECCRHLGPPGSLTGSTLCEVAISVS